MFAVPLPTADEGRDLGPEGSECHLTRGDQLDDSGIVKPRVLAAEVIHEFGGPGGSRRLDFLNPRRWKRRQIPPTSALLPFFIPQLAGQQQPRGGRSPEIPISLRKIVKAVRQPLRQIRNQPDFSPRVWHNRTIASCPILGRPGLTSPQLHRARRCVSIPSLPVPSGD